MPNHKVIRYTLIMQNTLLFIQEKKEILDAYQPISRSMLKPLEDWSKLEFTFTSNWLDGSTLSRAETAQVIDKGLTIGGKTVKEQNEAIQYARAVDWIRQSAHLSRYEITEQLLISLHHLPSLAENNDNRFLKYSFQVPYVLSEYVEWLHQQSGSEIEIAVRAHIKLLQLKPFADENIRTSRLLMNLLLLQDGYPLSFIREEDKDQYIALVEKTVVNGLPGELTELMYQSILKSLEVYVNTLEKRDNSVAGRLLKIGALAKLTNETIPTLRYWTKQGLLQVSDYSKGGYQLYSPDEAEKVIKIRDFQIKQRKTIKEIQEIISR